MLMILATISIKLIRLLFENSVLDSMNHMVSEIDKMSKVDFWKKSEADY